MKKRKEAKEENKKGTWNEDLWTYQVYCQHQLMSKPIKKSGFFRIKMERMSVFFFFFFFFPFLIYLFFPFSAFCNFFFCILLLHSLPLYISSNKHGFLNEMWNKSLIQRIFRYGNFLLRKLKIWWCD